jgi:secreted Zn-dependent insulinase-like peptidase
VERERNAVQAEYQMGLKSDPRRGLDVLQASMNPSIPSASLQWAASIALPTGR